MRRIDTWLNIQRYVNEAARVASAVPSRLNDIEVWAKAGASHRKRERARRRLEVMRLV